MSSVKNLFSGVKHAQLYAKFRPSPPEELITSIIHYLQTKINPPFKKAIDVGCGSGQSTIALSPHFEEVVGYDISEAQLSCAREMYSAHNVDYRLSKGMPLPVSTRSVDLVTFSQSIHWFNLDETFAEVNRMLKPNGVAAVYAYWIPILKTNEEKDKLISDLINRYLHDEQLGSYWESQRYIVQNHYSTVKLPFRDTCRMNFIKKSYSTIADYLGYLRTWSAYQTLLKEESSKAESLLNEIENKLNTIIKCKETNENTEWLFHTDYFLLLGRK